MYKVRQLFGIAAFGRLQAGKTWIWRESGVRLSRCIRHQCVGELQEQHEAIPGETPSGRENLV